MIAVFGSIWHSVRRTGDCRPEDEAPTLNNIVVLPMLNSTAFDRK